MRRNKEMERLVQEINKCKGCGLCNSRNKPVVGEGLLSARIMFVGEAPGRLEDQEGRPFVGRAGRIFDELLKSIGMVREEIYITNILKCRPPNNRNPKPEEIKACGGYLNRQIAIIQPEIIASLGNFAYAHISGKFNLKQERIGKVHGRVFNVTGPAGVKKIIPLYHPAVVAYNPGMKNLLLADFQVLVEANKTCKWYDECPMKRFYEEGRLEERWIREYCKGNYRGCVRYRLEEEGKPHPDNMLPDGTIRESLYVR
ncbi:MAG: uracil-DNA glycosylase [Candidatus Altiarchaeales archaeon]|nr:uracil-DNA glycosylase [Candidatus Altiarchaeales archaeon]